VNNKDVIIENICGLMFPGAYYPIDVIKDQYGSIFDSIEDTKKIAAILLGESKKSNSKVIRGNMRGATVYSLNDKYNFDDARKLTEATSVVRMAEVIRDRIQKQNIETLNEWLENDLYDVLSTLVEDKIKTEFRDEVMPVLTETITKTVTAKVKHSKGSFKKLLLETISDLINSIDEVEVGL